jgi:transaldolase/glucose-6-phosphate isomerase
VDATAWKLPEAHSAIIRNALGWLHVAEMMAEHAGELQSWADGVRKAGFEHVVVLGMGGSSLCPEVLRRTFGKIEGYPQLHVLDSTVPAAIRRLDAELDDHSTLFIVASKSGTTTEPQMFYRYYFDRMKRALSGQAGERFVAITDAGTPLEQEARRDGFRRVFLNPGDIGGRYSALSYFGMVPFALMGGDVAALIGRALHAVHACAPSVAVNENPGARLGAALGSLARAGRNKLTLITSPPIDSLGLWIEQLIAESTGKAGRGIVPVAGEALGSANDYGNDRVFAYVHVGMADDSIEQQLRGLESAGHPVLRRRLHDPLDLGEEFFIWEFATAIAGALLEIDPFDQPNVQESKDNTKQLLAEYGRSGKLAEQVQVLAEGQLRVFADAGNRAALKGADGSLAALLRAHLGRAGAGDYVAITQYIEASPEHDELLEQLRLEVRAQTRAATTTGYGPRFLHSTGQLHKGGPDSGVFLQITAGDTQDVDIPGEPFTFGVLKQAQALGDFQSLVRRGRRALRVDLGRDVERGLQQLLAALRGAASEQSARTVA